MGNFPFRNPDVPVGERVKDLLKRLTLPKKISQMVHASAAIPRLDIPAYNWWNDSGKRILEPEKFRISIGGRQPDARSVDLAGTPAVEAVFEVTGNTRELAY